MSAAGAAPATSHDLTPAGLAELGYPLLPLEGFARTGHGLIRGLRVCGSLLEFSIVLLIHHATVGWQRDWAPLALKWFGEKTGRKDRRILEALAEGIERGVIQCRRTSGSVSVYRVNYEALEALPDYAAPEPVAAPVEAQVRQVPRTRYVGDGQVCTPDGQAVPRYADGPLLVAEDEDITTVARCGVCDETGIYSMVSTSAVFCTGDEKANTESSGALSDRSVSGRKAAAAANSPPTATHKPAPKPPSGASGRPPATAPGGPDKPKRVESVETKVKRIAKSRGVTPERLLGVHGFLSSWEWAFSAAPTLWQAADVAVELGDAPVEVLAAIADARQEWLHHTALHYGAFKALAKQALEARQDRAGTPCPCGKSRLEVGQMCADCAHQRQAPAKPPPESRKRVPEDPVWTPVKALLRQWLSPGSYSNWFAGTYGRSCDPEELSVVVPDEPTGAFIQSEYRERVADALAECGQEGLRVVYVVEEDAIA